MMVKSTVLRADITVFRKDDPCCGSFAGSDTQWPYFAVSWLKAGLAGSYVFDDLKGVVSLKLTNVWLGIVLISFRTHL